MSCWRGYHHIHESLRRLILDTDGHRKFVYLPDGATLDELHIGADLPLNTQAVLTCMGVKVDDAVVTQLRNGDVLRMVPPDEDDSRPTW